jgi:hypothetical protein
MAGTSTAAPWRKRARPRSPRALGEGLLAGPGLCRAAGRDRRHHATQPQPRYVVAGAAYMWLFKVSWEIPFDDSERLRRRLHIDYPIRIDSFLGGDRPRPGVDGLRSGPPATGRPR